MKKYVIKFEHLQKVECFTEVEACSYEDAMDMFEKSPFRNARYLKTEQFEEAENNGYHVSRVTEDGKEVYKDIRKFKAELTV